MANAVRCELQNAQQKITAWKSTRGKSICGLVFLGSHLGMESRAWFYVESSPIIDGHDFSLCHSLHIAFCGFETNVSGAQHPSAPPSNDWFVDH